MFNFTVYSASFFLLAAALANPASAQPVPTYNVILGWDAASEETVDAAWHPHHNPLDGEQVWTWSSAEFPNLRAVDEPDLLGLDAAFESVGDVGASLTPVNPQSIPLDPTNGAASIEMWVRPSSLTGGPQLLTSFGNAFIGTSLTLDDDILRLQVRRSDVRRGLDLSVPRNGIVDDGLEDLIGVIKTRLPDAGQFVHVVASIETGGSAPSLALYINGALASPLDDGGTGLFKDESLVAQGASFDAVEATAGQNPLPTRTMTAAPSVAAIAIDDWSGRAAGALIRTTSVIGGHAAPAGGPLDLTRFRSRSFQGEVAAFNIYSRALNERQVAVVHRQVAEGLPLAPSIEKSSDLLLDYDAAIGALSGGSDWENRHPVNLPRVLPGNALDWSFARSDNSNLITEGVSGYPGITAAYVFTRGSADDDGILFARRSNGSTASGILGILGAGTTLNDATIEFWFKPSDLQGKQVLFETGGGFTGTSLRLNNSDLEFAVRHGSNPDPAARDALATVSLGAVDLDEFIQAVGVIDLSGNAVRLYLNGALETEVPFFGSSWDGGDSAALGAVRGGLGGGQGTGFGEYAGQMASLRLYGGALSSEEINERFKLVSEGPGGEPEAGLLGYWTFDEGEGSTAHDTSGNANHGELLNAGWAPGRIGNALSLSGLNDSHVRVPASESLNDVTDAITVMAWVFPTAPIPSRFITIAQRQVGDVTHPDQFYLGFGPIQGVPRFKWHSSTFDGTTPRESSVYTGDPPVNTWFHMAGTYDGEFLRMYVDGVQIGRSRPLAGNIRVDNNNLTIGAEESGPAPKTIVGEFTGLIDELRIYNRALSVEEIERLMNQ